MKVEDLNKLQHAEFRVFAQLDESGEMIDVYLLPRRSGVFDKRLSIGLVKNTPSGGVLALLERYWQLEKNFPSPLYAAAPDLLAALEMMFDNPHELEAQRAASAAIAKAKGGLQ